MALPASPSWPSSSPVSSPESSTSSSPTSAPPSSLTPSEQLSDLGPRLDVPVPLPRTRATLASSHTPTPPPLSSSPSPSSISSGTARPAVTLSTLRDGLDNIRQQILSMLDQQNAANRQLDDLRNRPREPIPQPADRWDEFSQRLQIIEESILRLLERGTVPQPQPRGPESVREPDAESSVHTDWRSIINGILSGEQAIGEPPVIHAPVPQPARPSFDEQLMEILMAPPSQSQQQALAPPQLIPLIYRPAPRARPRSQSPIYDLSPPRPDTVPLVQPRRRERTRQQPPRPPPVRARMPEMIPPTGPPPSEPESGMDIRDPAAPTPTGAPRDQGPNIDFLRAVQDNRVRSGRPPWISTEERVCPMFTRAI